MSHDGRVHLPVVDPPASSIARDGRRNFVHPADVKGRFVRLRYVVFAALIAIWALLPWVQVGGKPALYLDVAARRFYLFGGTYNSQDFWLVFFLLSGVGLTLFFATTVLGRVWCGWACPQTVFLEGVFRRIERLVEGNRQARLRRNAAPMSIDKLWRKALKHLLFAVAALGVSHIFLSFFVSMPSMLSMIGASPSAHPGAFTWMAVTSVILYGNFAWFREQLCLIVCPYGRLQSVMTDRDSLVVGYDALRGEPRGKVKDASAGDCVDCGRCVVVCPTGIDIRNGLQLDCIGCTACIDACDEIMTKLKRPTGLVRYDSLNGLEHRPRRWLRPRVFLYAGVVALWAVGAFFAFRSHVSFEANLLRLRGAPYHVLNAQTEDATVRNLFQVHLVNKGPDEARFEIEAIQVDGHEVTLSADALALPSLSDREIAIYVDVPRERFEQGQVVRVRVRRVDEVPGEGEERLLEAPLLGPRR